MKRIQAALDKIPWLAYVLAVIGAGWYAFQTWILAHNLTTMILDESMYVYKGYLFAIGKYTAYQDYGPLTNHMPLSFIIPGFIQRIFGPGMLTARMFAFITGLIMLAGFWLAFKRLGGKWWGTFIIWLLALNPTWQEVFSQGLTQGLVNALIAWGFVLLITKNPTRLQMGLSGGLLALAVMTRINTLPILVFFILYVFWQHGWRKGLAAAFGGLLVGAVTLGLFWPGVLKFISGWIPEGLLSFVEPFRSPWSQQHVPTGFTYFPLSAWISNPDSLQWSGIKAFSGAINFNLVPFLTVAGTLFFWPRRGDWKSDRDRHLSIILVLTWLVMAGMHIWVAMSGRSCRFFCLPGYFTFFNFTALLLLPIASSRWRKRAPGWRNSLAMGTLFGFTYATLFTAGYRQRWLYGRWYKFMFTEIPLFSDGKIIWDEKGVLLSLLEAKLNLSYEFLVEVLPTYLYWVLLLLLFLIVPLIHKIRWPKTRGPVSIPWLSVAIFLGLSVILGPTPIFRYESAVMACDDSVIASHEEVAAELDELIEPGSLVYHNLSANMLFLYLPDIELFPPQLNTTFNYVEQSIPEESDEIYRFGYWDEHLKQDWLSQADILLIPNQFSDDYQTEMNSDEWQMIGEVGPYESCRPNQTVVYVLQKVTPDE